MTEARRERSTDSRRWSPTLSRIPRSLRNVPLPEPHLIALAVGVGASMVSHRQVHLPRSLRPLGLVTAAAGAAVVAWATTSTASTDLSKPDRLITAGPYAFSRNPMYVAWTVLYVGVGLSLRSAWVLALLPAVLGATHWSVKHEEKHLRDRFGSQYREYTTRVRRYL